ncbi:peptidoglycan-binding domain-containing protein [Ruminococcus flavefaciens]|uniref:peptidoglycan-binding domain-containing protein n=1 Tax=Ruminococcus flavefaciens TaxID=1265 RepID=UPI0004920B27|nr:peptidoglycan-binding domain-containing protein [Ruminococcus flavefaciens]
MNNLKKALVIASAAVMCAVPFAPSIADNSSLIGINSITADAATSPYKTPNLKKLNNGRKYYSAKYDSGKRYEDVKWIQDAYMKIRADQYYYVQQYALPAITVDGYYGNKTADAITKFQSWFHCDSVDGAAGAETITKLKDLLAQV